MAVNVPAFTGSTVVELPIPCSYDFTLAATKYFDALDDGEVPLSLLFSGTVFYSTSDGSLQVEQVPWEKEATFRLPIGVWRNMMNHYYPNSAWLCLRKDVFDRLASFKSRGASTDLGRGVGLAYCLPPSGRRHESVARGSDRRRPCCTRGTFFTVPPVREESAAMDFWRRLSAGVGGSKLRRRLGDADGMPDRGGSGRRAFRGQCTLAIDGADGRRIADAVAAVARQWPRRLPRRREIADRRSPFPDVARSN